MTPAADDPDCLREIALLALDRGHPLRAQQVAAQAGYAWFVQDGVQGNCDLTYGPWAASDSPQLRAQVEATDVEQDEGARRR